MADAMTMKNCHSNDGNKGEFICGVVEGFYGKPWSCDQRKDLFKRLKNLNLNAFMYAPKDDLKHRARWRLPYSDVEAMELKELIDEAKSNGIDFFYSLAPGLDMVYSDQEELDLVVKKYDQLLGLGCECFAILFDDIEPSINEKDREVFDNYAAAQVSVTNMIFEHLKRPKFLFCPTEYCESRAMPNVPNSNYLKTLGAGLLGGIDIMWSGSRVISRLITEDSIAELTETIKRPPVLWENLHANDYDKKRVYLGPYSGRSTKIIPKLKGILTNPNCEYEANYIAIHTLAQWCKCTEDINLHNRCNPSRQLHISDNQVSQVNSSVYDPERALILAIKDWLPVLLEKRSLPVGMNLASQSRERSDETAQNQLFKQDVLINKDTDDTNVDMIPDETQSSGKSEMETSSSAPINMVDTSSCDSCDMQVISESSKQQRSSSAYVDCVMCSLNKTDKQSLNETSNEFYQVDYNDLSVLVDLFYLPFEHGSYGYTLLNEIKWLKDNSGVILSEKLPINNEELSSKDAQMNEENDFQETGNGAVESWINRADKLTNLCSCISKLVNTLIHNCPNKLLIFELYPYLADMRDVTSMITDYIRFLRYRTSALDKFYCSAGSSKPKELALSDEQEPWVHRGGLIGDVQRLIT